jgi:hypothetical protein
MVGIHNMPNIQIAEKLFCTEQFLGNYTGDIAAVIFESPRNYSHQASGATAIDQADFGRCERTGQPPCFLGIGGTQALVGTAKHANSPLHLWNP